MEKLIWRIEKRRPDELKVWDDNPRTIGEKEFAEIKKSIQEDGDWGILSIDVAIKRWENYINQKAIKL